MEMGMIGLGRMGLNMVRRLLKAKHKLIVFNRSREKIIEAEKEGAVGARSLEDLVKLLKPPRIVWLMLPAGTITEEYIHILSSLLEQEDLVIEGGNSSYREDLRHYSFLKDKGIHYLDAGVSGGVWGYSKGYCMMIGGDYEKFRQIEPLLRDLAPESGYHYCGLSGAGHYVKMIHNAIEYALMEAYGEGFEILKASPYGQNMDLAKIAHVWNQGSVVRSWLLELLESAFLKDRDLSEIQGYVEDSGEVRGAVKEALDMGVAADVIAHSVFKRFQSRQEDVFSDKVVAALRKEFGNHYVARKGDRVRKGMAGAGAVEHAKPDVNPPVK